jgi:hypothetical protein
MARRTTRLGVDRLESREVLSGNVTAYVSSNTLFLVEQAGQYGQSNAVQVTQLASGNIRVSGLVNGTGTVSKVNGAAYQDFALPNGTLVASLGAGNDLIRVVNAKFNNVNLDLSYPNTNDADVIDVNGVQTTGAMQLRTGGGIDTISVRGTKVGDGSGYEDLNINSGAGADSVKVGQIGGAFVQVHGNLILNTFTSLAEVDPDTVQIYQTLVYKSIYLDTGAGNDTIKLGDVTAGVDIVLVAGDGNDKANLDEVWAYNNFFVAMATGNDTLDVQYLRANYLSLDGGPGFDTLNHYIDGPTGHTVYTGFGYINGRRIFRSDDFGVFLGGGLLAM